MALGDVNFGGVPLFPTVEIALSQPVDLAAHAAIPTDPDGFGRRVFVQNTNDRPVRWREGTADAPEPADAGHVLAPGDGVVILLHRDVPFWWWSPTEGQAIMVSAGAGPERQVGTVDFTDKSLVGGG